MGAAQEPENSNIRRSKEWEQRKSRKTLTSGGPKNGSSAVEPTARGLPAERKGSAWRAPAPRQNWLVDSGVHNCLAGGSVLPLDGIALHQIRDRQFQSMILKPRLQRGQSTDGTSSCSRSLWYFGQRAIFQAYLRRYQTLQAKEAIFCRWSCDINQPSRGRPTAGTEHDFVAACGHGELSC